MWWRSTAAVLALIGAALGSIVVIVDQVGLLSGRLGELLGSRNSRPAEQLIGSPSVVGGVEFCLVDGVDGPANVTFFGEGAGPGKPVNQLELLLRVRALAATKLPLKVNLVGPGSLEFPAGDGALRGFREQAGMTRESTEPGARLVLDVADIEPQRVWVLISTRDVDRLLSGEVKSLGFGVEIVPSGNRNVADELRGRVKVSDFMINVDVKQGL